MTKMPSKCAEVGALVKTDDQDSEDIVAWYCRSCGLVYKKKEYAERCTKCAVWTCERCGDEASAWQTHCSACLGDIRDERDKEKLQNVERIPVSEYPDNQGVVWDNEYYCSVEALIDHCELEDIEVPVLVLATKPIHFSLDGVGWVEDRFEDWLEGEAWYEAGSIKGMAEFLEAVKKFNSANDHLVMYLETEKAVDLSEAIENNKK